MKAVMFHGVGDPVIDAVGVDANRPAGADDERFEEAIEQLVPERAPQGPNWQPGSGPTQVLEPHRELTRAGVIGPSALVTQIAATHNVIEAYEHFDQRRPGWLKVALDPAAVSA